MFDHGLVDQVVRKIAGEFNPERIIIFGSAAKGEAGDQSDLDILVVMNTELPYYKRAPEVRRKLLEIPLAMDILVTTPEEFGVYKDDNRSFIKDIVRTGKIAYESGDRIEKIV
jgi:predicted nucleotidyltransferase